MIRTTLFILSLGLSLASAQISPLLDQRGIDASPYSSSDVDGPGIVPVGKTFPSPDQRFSFTLIKKGPTCYIKIADHRTGTVQLLDQVYPPILSLKWSPDSHSILLTEHGAEGSVFGLMHWTGQTWWHYPIDPPGMFGDSDHCHALAGEFKADHVEAEYLIDRFLFNKVNNLSICSFDISLETARPSHVTRKPITMKQYRAFRTNLN